MCSHRTLVSHCVCVCTGLLACLLWCLLVCLAVPDSLLACVCITFEHAHFPESIPSQIPTGTRRKLGPGKMPTKGSYLHSLCKVSMIESCLRSIARWKTLCLEQYMRIIHHTFHVFKVSQTHWVGVAYPVYIGIVAVCSFGRFDTQNLFTSSITCAKNKHAGKFMLSGQVTPRLSPNNSVASTQPNIEGYKPLCWCKKKVVVAVCKFMEFGHTKPVGRK